ncbi:MAG: preprotein translocase subunit SecY [Planctomycetaceae bacterium]|jgi:preprotein translocase subunit SecY|nr:preprotein translocase subunit SecY [Planctomycetaceae bacterium]
MFGKLIMIFRIPELRRKIFLTLALLAVYRMGFAIPLPFIDQDTLKSAVEDIEGADEGFGQVMQIVALFSASSLGNSTIFGLGIMPYISASIIFQLLGTVYPPLEKLQKEGESGRRKINEYTRYATVIICLGQSFFWIQGLSGGTLMGENLILDQFDSTYYYIIGTITMTAGTVLLMWIGEQIDAYGIGNGISLLIMAGILARMPAALLDMLAPALTDGVAIGSDTGIDRLLLLLGLFVGIVIWVIAITQGQRRIPIQSAKHLRGRRVAGGQRQSLPLRVNQAGVMPIIFASSLLLFPYFLFSQIARLEFFSDIYVVQLLARAFSDHQYVYNMSYIFLIYFFCYFWTTITFNPKDIAENLKDYGSFIPGYRPGARTAAYLESVMTRITYVGAAFLALVAVIPTVVATYMNIPPMVASFYGGTGLLIVVSVCLDLVQKIDSHLVMRNYPGLLDADD